MKKELVMGIEPKKFLNNLYHKKEEITKMQQGLFPACFLKYSTKGIYCVRFFINGKWRYVIVGFIKR